MHLLNFLTEDQLRASSSLDSMTTATDSDFSVDALSLSSSVSHAEIQNAAQDLIFRLGGATDHELYALVKKCIKMHKHRACDIFVTDVGGWTPFHAITLRGKKKTIQAMLNMGVDVNHRMGKPDGLPGGCTPLHVAAYRGDVKVIKCILTHGGHVNASNSDNLTAIYYAMMSHNTEAVNLLLLYGADLKGIESSEPNKTITKSKKKIADKYTTSKRGLSKIFGSSSKKL